MVRKLIRSIVVVTPARRDVDIKLGFHSLNSDQLRACIVMLNLLIGGIVGIAIAAFIQQLDSQSDAAYIQTVTNIVIALATVAAVLITRQQHIFQKNNRIWDAKKEPLLDLSKTISDALRISEQLMDEAFEGMQNIPITKPTGKSETKIFRELDTKLRHTIEAYAPIISNSLIATLNEHLKSQKTIEQAYDIDHLSLYEAYDSSTSALRKLLKDVNEQIRLYAAA